MSDASDPTPGRGAPDAPPIPTLAAIRAALDGVGARPSRRFGQNFLTDPALLLRIVSDAEVGPGDVVLEVGPGPGALTAALLASGAEVVAVEVDREMRAVLGALLGEPRGLEVVAADILEAGADLPAAARAALARAATRAGRDPDPIRFALVANLPYQVSATLLADLVWSGALERAVVTIQREVAERLAAAPASPAYGPLSVMVQLRATARVLRRLAPGAFWPAPKVESAVVRLDPSSDAVAPSRHAAVRAAVRGAFFARRKRAARSLSLAFPELGVAAAADALRAAGLDPDARGETFPPAAFVALAAELEARGAVSTSGPGAGAPRPAKRRGRETLDP